MADDNCGEDLPTRKNGRHIECGVSKDLLAEMDDGQISVSKCS